MHHPKDRIAHTTVFVTPVAEDIERQYITRSAHRKRKEGNVLFNDALNTFYLRLYGVSHMVKLTGEMNMYVIRNACTNKRSKFAES